VAAQPDSKVERDLLRLVYVSRATPGLTAADLAAIEASSAGRNRAAGLTGLLLHRDGSFFALLEGPRRRLLARMERIITDPRHRGVDILVETAIPARRFESWSFGRFPGAAASPCSAGDDFLRILGSRLK
jgi:hypothetical protein